MPSEIEEIRNICERYLEDFKKIKVFTIIYAKRTNGHWKVIVRYSKPDKPEIISSLMVDLKTKQVDSFMEDIPTF